MKTALVTGADGFIGSHLTQLLLKKGYRVKALAQYNSFNNWGWLEDVHENKNIEIVTGDVRDPQFCMGLVNGIDLIFHLAALIAIPYSYIASDSYIDTNIKGTHNICKAAKENGNLRLIHTSTSEVYGTAKYVPIDENHPLQPQSPYSASKIGADAIALSFYNSFKLPVTIARPFNTFGPRQSARAVIPTLISQIKSGLKNIKAGDVRPTRDFNYVKDTCMGLLALAECDEAIGKTVNISTNTEISIGEVFKLIKKLIEADAELISDKKRLRPEKSEVFRLVGDNTLIKTLTGWRPEYSFEEGLQETINWFSDPGNLKKYKTDIYNI